MTFGKFVRWWPPVGLLGMVLVGVAVGKGSTTVDDAFQQAGRAGEPYTGWLLFFTDPRVLGVLWVGATAWALWQRRWWLAAAVAVAPVVSTEFERLCKQLFGRHKGHTLSYPSGHTALMVTVVGMVVVVAGAVLWSRVLAGVFAVLGMLGQAFTYHYFTDTVGALFFASALVCLVAWATEPAPS